nr:MAG TPA: hypothetical protein [Ackermannviridae sp.]
MVDIGNLKDFDVFKNEILRNLGLVVKTFKIVYNEENKMPTISIELYEDNEEIEHKLTQVLDTLNIIDDFKTLGFNIEISYWNEDLTITALDGREILNRDFGRYLITHLYSTIITTKDKGDVIE